MQAVGRFLGSRWLSSEQGNAIIRKLRSRNLIADMTPYIVSRVYFLIRVSGEFPPPGSAFYIGFDPTACSLHLGNLLGLIVATHLRLEGYQPIFLVGGGTARVGDPSFRASAKQRLADEKILQNSTRISHQIQMIASTGLQHVTRGMSTTTAPLQLPNVQLLDNYEWQQKISLLEFLDLVGSKMRLASMLARESVQRRLQSPEGMSFTEFSYQLLQGYDFYHLWQHHGCRLQLGGSDQWGNMLAGVEMIGKLGTTMAMPFRVAALTFPLLTASDGRKMGKSDGNSVWLDAQMTSPLDFYQHLLRLSDADAIHLLPMLTFLPLTEVKDVARQHSEHPERRLAQQILASHVTAFVHGPQDTNDAIEASRLLFDEYSSDILLPEANRQLLGRTLRQSNRLLSVQSSEQTLRDFLLKSLPPVYSKGNIFSDGI